MFHFVFAQYPKNNLSYYKGKKVFSNSLNILRDFLWHFQIHSLNTINKSYYEKRGSQVRCVDDEIPFEIPESWSWIKIKQIFIINPRNYIEDATHVSFIPMSLITDGFGNKHSHEKRVWGEVKNGFTHFQDNDLGIAKITPCFENRKSVVFNNLINSHGAGTTELHILRPIYCNQLSEYALWLVKTCGFILGGVENFNGAVGQQRVSKEYVSETYLPLPPANELCRIISEVKSIFALIDSIEADKSDLRKAIKQAKAKVLDLAIRGKLVEQDPTDEPASILLERIKAEKQASAKGSKKQQKQPAATSDNSHYENMPFEIPN